MQTLTTTLSMTTILIVLFLQTTARTPNLFQQLAPADMILLCGLLICAGGFLTSYLNRPLPQPEEDEDSTPRQDPPNKDH